MNILFLADAVFDDLPGGSRTAAKELAIGLTKRGHSVTFFVGRQKDDSPTDEIKDGIRIVRYEGASLGMAYILSGREAMKRLLKNQSFDIVHTHFAYSAIGPLFVLSPIVPRVRTFHGPWDQEGWVEDISKSSGIGGKLKARLKRAGRFAIEKYNLSRSDRVIVLSESFKNNVLRYGISPDRVSKIPGGVDLVRFSPLAADEITRERIRINIPVGRPVAFTVRRLTARMGLDNLIRALPTIIEKLPDFLLIIGGTGPLRNSLEDLAAKLGVVNSVRFAGFIEDCDLPAYYQTADVFVLPTIALEGFGLVTVEALACGTPVIGTPVGATPEILNEIDTRLVTTGTNSNALAERITSFFTEPWSSEHTRAQLRSHCEQHYSWDRNVEQTESLYRALLP